ncbi:hypothetical protein D9756_002739 [Leucocoprinus leucothites]|uniref:VPS9 domain-containing protein n=1 Tax=Leucocoprinus leucothites TaxID=201217 RepID=A0A8H5GCG6_9AGAR|nr:hypothetical protein D9756_002739 [Leucoagaricus leucothites]
MNDEQLPYTTKDWLHSKVKPSKGTSSTSSGRKSMQPKSHRALEIVSKSVEVATTTQTQELVGNRHQHVLDSSAHASGLLINERASKVTESRCFRNSSYAEVQTGNSERAKGTGSTSLSVSGDSMPRENHSSPRPHAMNGAMTSTNHIQDAGNKNQNVPTFFSNVRDLQINNSTFIDVNPGSNTGILAFTESRDGQKLKRALVEGLEFVPLAKECMADTRVEILSDIDARIRDNEDSNLIWVKGFPNPRQTSHPPPQRHISRPQYPPTTVKSNPPHLVSHLLFLQRFRHRNAYANAGNESEGGEESFCLINMLAVAEFLENVDLAGSGLGGVASGTEVSATELTPIITRSGPQKPTTPTLTPKSSFSLPLLSSSGGDRGVQLPGSSFLRGKVEQQVDAIAGSANKVILGVVDSSFGILRSFLPQNHPDNVSSIPADAVASSVVNGSVSGMGITPTTAKPGQGGFGLLKRETSSGGVFSIASIAASIPSISSRNSNKAQGGEEGQQLVTVSSRPGSIKSFRSGRGGGEHENEEEIDEEDEEDSDEDSDEDDTSGSNGETGSEEEGIDSDVEHRAGGVDIPGIQINSPHCHAHPYANSNSSISKHASASAGSFGGNATDTRSIRSFESMLSDDKKRRQQEKKLKKLAKESEKERRREEKALRAREKEMRRGKERTCPSVGALAGVKDSPPDSRRSSLLPLAAPVPTVSDTSSNHQQPSEQYMQHGTSPSSSRVASPSLPLSRSPSPLPSTTVLPGSSLDAPSAITKSTLASTAAPVRVPRLNVDGGVRLPLPQPTKRFIECASVDELSIGEVRELLSEYRRLVEGVRELDGFSV